MFWRTCPRPGRHGISDGFAAPVRPKGWLTNSYGTRQKDSDTAIAIAVIDALDTVRGELRGSRGSRSTRCVETIQSRGLMRRTKPARATRRPLAH